MVNRGGWRCTAALRRLPFLFLFLNHLQKALGGDFATFATHFGKDEFQVLARQALCGTNIGQHTFDAVHTNVLVVRNGRLDNFLFETRRKFLLVAVDVLGLAKNQKSELEP